jgi:hypothetical protein
MGKELLINNLMWLVTIGLVWFLRTYVGKKGENLATKEDIEEITRKVEGVRAQFASENELLKSELNKLVIVHKVQFEKEFTILSDIWGKLVALRDATLALRSPLVVGTKPSEEECLGSFAAAWENFRALVEMNRPFYPQQIYDELHALLKLSGSEAMSYRLGPLVRTEESRNRYWEMAEKNRIQILDSVDKLCGKIRERIVA